MFLLFFFVLFSVNCEHISNNETEGAIPDNKPVTYYKKPFQVYWNVATKRCKAMGVLFENLYEKYGIHQNEGDKFTGEKITILYDPGFYPSIVMENGTMQKINGGVPQEGNIEIHLKAFRKSIEKEIPDAGFNGIGIIDFEAWKAVFRHNFGTQVVYKNVSYHLERKNHDWPDNLIENEAKERFEKAARAFIQTSLSIAKQMRPYALWGYYGYPYCFNMAYDMQENCSNAVKADNDQMYWLWSESTALYPSIYRTQDLSQSQLASLIRGRVEEASRVRRRNTPIFPYFWYRYRDGGFLSDLDLATVLQTLYRSNASGFIIWGSWQDLDTVDKCIILRNYLDNTLGPAIAKLTKHSKFQDEMPIEEILASPNNNSTNATLINSTHKQLNDTNEHTTEQQNTTHSVTLNIVVTINFVEEECKKPSQSIITQLNMNKVIVKSAINIQLNNSQSIPEIINIDDHVVNSITVHPFKNESVGDISDKLDMNTKTSNFEETILDTTTENNDLIDDFNTQVEASTINTDINSNATNIDIHLKDFTTESHNSSTILNEESYEQFFNGETLFNPSNPDNVNKDSDNTTDNSSNDTIEANNEQLTPIILDTTTENNDLIDDFNTQVGASTINTDINSNATNIDIHLKDFTTESHNSSTILNEESYEQFFNGETLFNPSNPDNVNKDSDNTTDNSSNDTIEANNEQLTTI